MAVTHTEVYRSFEGRLQRRALPWWPITASGIAVAWKRKLPALILYIPPGIATIVHCFLVYSRFMLQSQAPAPSTPTEMIAMGLASQLLEVRRIISDFNVVMATFSMLAMAWYGAGLIAEDRRHGAHLLYFSRPLTRLQYALGKFGTVAFWGACASFLPGLIICLVATFTSPEWSFLKHEWTTIVYTVTYATLWITAIGSVVLAVSSVMPRKTFALIGIVAFLFLTGTTAQVLTEVTDKESFGLFSVFAIFQKLREWLFIARDPSEFWAKEAWPFAVALGVILVGCWTVIFWRVRRMEVVA